MLPAPYRFQLRQHPTFFSTARRVFSPYLTLWYQESTGGRFQAAFIISKKNFKRATARHRLLRQLRAGVARFMAAQESLPPIQAVIMPTRRASELPFTELESELSQLLKKMT